MSHTPDFSIIIPTHNRLNFLRQAIESVVAQRGVSLEVLIVNDGTDIVPPFPDPRVRVLDNERRGAVAARNLGIASASGQRIAFLDDDDWWTHDEHLLFHQDAAADFVFSDGELIFMDGSPPLEFAMTATADSLRSDNTILISSVSYSRVLHEKHGLFDEALPYYADWDWYLRVVAAGVSLLHLDANTVAVRVHPANTSGPSQEIARAANLARLCAKHGLGPIPLKNHVTIAQDAAVTLANSRS